MGDYVKYDKMENTLQLINGYFISLSNDEMKRNNIILKKVIGNIVERMRQKDNLFNDLYTEIYYGGSYFDGLKVGKPNEYDIDIILGPKKIKKSLLDITHSNKPGYVHAKLINDSDYSKICTSGTKNLDTFQVKRWIQGLIQKVLNDFPKKQSAYDLSSICEQPIDGKLVIQGPAFTFKIRGKIDGQQCTMDIDLVPCFYCLPNQWPNGIKKNPYPEKGFFIVPKTPKTNDSEYWRLSFQEQERSLMSGKERLKPALKLLKKLRDTLDHPVASYYLKTIVLWQLDQETAVFWNDKTLSYIFMRILTAYKNQLKLGEILYYWHKRHNLLDLSPITTNGFGNQIERIIKNVNNNMENPGDAIAKYILTEVEYNELKNGKIPQSAITEAEKNTQESLQRRSCIIS